MWFTDTNSYVPAVGRIDPKAWKITEYTRGLGANAVPLAIITGTDGNLWFADAGNGAIGKVTLQGAIREYSDRRLTHYSAIGIAESAGAIWALEVGARRSYLARVGLAGGLGLVQLPRALTVAQFSSLVSDDSGNLWFIALTSDNTVYLIERTANGTFIKVPTGLMAGHEQCCVNVAAKNMYFAHNGVLWFTTLYYQTSSGSENALAALRSDGVHLYYLRAPSVDFAPFPSGIAGDGKDLWVGAGSFGQPNGVLFDVKRGGTYASYPVSLSPVGLAVSIGSKRHLWFTSYYPGAGAAIAEVL